MKVLHSTALIFAILLLALAANAQYSQPQVARVPGPAPVVIPAPPMQQGYYNGYYGPQQPPPQVLLPQTPMYQGYNPGYFNQPSYTMPSYNQNNWVDSQFDYSGWYSNFNSSFNPFDYVNRYDSQDSSQRTYSTQEEADEARDREEERQERREEKAEEAERRREDAKERREEEKRQAREDRDREKRKSSRNKFDDDGADDQKVKPKSNWPPVPKSSAEGKKILADENKQNVAPKTGENAAAETKAGAKAPQQLQAKTQSPSPKAQPQAAPASGNKAAETEASMKQANTPPAPAAPVKKHWWETDPEYQKYLNDKKAAATAPAATENQWPPKAKPLEQISTNKFEASGLTGCENCNPKKGTLTAQVASLPKTSSPLTRNQKTEPDSKVGEGIRRVMNTLYQSCSAYDKWIDTDYCASGFVGAKDYCHKDYPKKPGDLKAYDYLTEKDNEGFFSYELASKPGADVMVPEKPEGPQCRDMTKTPPVFRYDGRPSISQTNGKVTLNMFNESKTGGKFVTLGCSGFVTAAYAAAGLNFAPNSPTAQVTTASLHSGAAKCLATPTLSANGSVKSGDIVLFGEHSMILDHVGSDPFALNSLPTPPSGTSLGQFCINNLQPSSFQFIITQSGVAGGREAIAQMRATDYFAYNGEATFDEIKKKIATDTPNLETRAQFFQIAVDACVAKLSNTTKPATRGPKAATILRHKGSAAPGCVRSSPPEIVGQACVKGCT